jgi:L-lactate dehydrogenase complex protein LldG
MEPGERESRFIRGIESHGTAVALASTLGDLPAAVATLLAGEEAIPRLVVSADPRLAALDWTHAGLSPHQWRPDDRLGDGTAALSHAAAAVSETGTLVLISGAANPASLAFLPELHLVALDRASIVASFEQAFRRIAEQAGSHRFPRAINLVSAASRTGDIGGKIVKGAHGPRRLAVILYGRSEMEIPHPRSASTLRG